MALRRTALRITGIELVTAPFSCGLGVIRPTNKAVSGERSRRTGCISYMFWYHSGNCPQPLLYPCSISIRRGTNLCTSQGDTGMASMGLWFRGIVLWTSQQLQQHLHPRCWRRRRAHAGLQKVQGTGWRLPAAPTAKHLQQEKVVCHLMVEP
jgi:hypothetical protein